MNSYHIVVSWGLYMTGVNVNRAGTHKHYTQHTNVVGRVLKMGTIAHSAGFAYASCHSRAGVLTITPFCLFELYIYGYIRMDTDL